MMWQGGDCPKFVSKNNLPDPLLSGEELPTFKLILGLSRASCQRRQEKQFPSEAHILTPVQISKSK
jgi:hypothetical protein